jgi:hypothetical protein
MSGSTTAALAAKIAICRAADNQLRVALDHDRETLFDESDRAEQSMIGEPCLSLEDVRAKVTLALGNEDVMDSITDCAWGGERGIEILLRSLLGLAPQVSR